MCGQVHYLLMTMPTHLSYYLFASTEAVQQLRVELEIHARKKKR